MSVANPASGGEQREDAFQLSAGQLVGRRRYTLRRQLGIGGMGVVWLAHDTRLNTLVALKFLSDQLRFDRLAIEELRRETLNCLQLTHPNILRIHDFVEEEGERPFISMEYVNGSTLSSLQALQRQCLLPWPQVRPIAAQLCDALDYAHSRRIVHRDLKPSNIMLDEAGTVKLMDFGVAAVAVESINRITHRESKGTPYYMSPQQTGGLGPQITDDIYSLGATLYELLTSKPPFFSGDIAYQVRQTLAEPIPERLGRLSLSNDIPPEVATMIMECLAKETAQRPQSAQTIKARLLGTASAGVPIHPGNFAPTEHISFDPRFSTKTSPRPRWAGAVMVIALAACVLGLFTLNERQRNSSDDTTAPSDIKTTDTKPVSSNHTEFKPEAGFTPLFPTDSLEGWTASPPDSWTIRNGVLTGFAEQPASLSFARELADFELRLSWKTSDPPEGSIAFRSLRGESDQLRYRLLLTGPRAGAIAMSDQGRFLQASEIGEVTSVENSLWKVVDATLKREQRETLVRTNDWNDLILVARGNHFTVNVNGKPAGEFTDHRQTMSLSGGLYFRLFPKRGDQSTLQVRHVRLKELPTSPPTKLVNRTARRTVAISPLPAVNENGFQPLFVDPSRWLFDDNKDFWTISNGVAKGVVQNTGESSSIVWRTRMADFELRFSARVKGRATFHYRELPRRENSANPFYFLTIADKTPGGIGLPTETGSQAFGPGTIITWRDGRIENTSGFRSLESILASYRPGDWNDYIVIAQNRCLTHYVNGKLTQELIHETFDPNAAEGRITFRVSTQVAAAPIEFEVRDARIKLNGASSYR